MLPALVVLNLAVGASVVLVNKRAAALEGPVRSTALAALLLFELMVLAPVSGYLLTRYPDWMLMYLVQPSDVAVPLWFWLALFPGAGVLGFWVTRHLVVRQKSLAAWGLLGGAGAVTLGILVFGHEKVGNVGTTDAMLRGGGMQPLLETPLAYLLGAAFSAVGAGWGATLWRLSVYGRVLGLGDDTEVDSTMIREGKADKKDKKKRKS